MAVTQKIVTQSKSLDVMQNTVHYNDISVVVAIFQLSQRKGCLSFIANAAAKSVSLILVRQGQNNEVSVWSEDLGAEGSAIQSIDWDKQSNDTALKRGLASVEMRFLAVKHRDCRVAADWLGRFAAELRKHPERTLRRTARAERYKIIPSVITAP